MFGEPTPRESNLQALVVNGCGKTHQSRVTRRLGLETCGYIAICVEGEGIFVVSDAVIYKTEL